MNIRVINSPSKGTIALLRERITSERVKTDLAEGRVKSVGLVQSLLADIITACDIAEKASDVTVCEIMGVCPQHVMLIGIFGDTASVETAVKAVKSKLNRAGET